MKLTIEHLSPYLPYELKVQATQHPQLDLTLHPIGGSGMVGISEVVYFEYYKPILRPMDDLQKEIPFNLHGVDFGKPVRFSDKGFFKRNVYDGYNFNNITNGHFDMAGQIKYFKYLYAHHFDIFGLIEFGLAVDINTLP